MILFRWHFLQHIHKRDVGQGRNHGFIRDQFIFCVNLIAAPLWITGLIATCGNAAIACWPGCI